MEHRPWFQSYPQSVPRSLSPYPERSLYALLEDAARRHPGAPAMVFRPPGSPAGKRLTYARLLEEVERFSRALAALGVRKGDRVALILPNCPQYVVAYYATLRIGAVAVGTNPLYTERELSHQLRDSGAEVCVTLDVLYPKLAAVREEGGVREVVVGRVSDYLPFPVDRLAPLRMRREARRHGEPWPPVPPAAPVSWWAELMAASHPQVPPAEVDPKEDLAALVYTGGTTGVSKGAMLTHFNLVANTLQSAAWFPDLEEGREAVLCVIPFFHSYGMTVGMNLGIYLASKLVLLPRFELQATLQAIQRERPSLFPGVPRLYLAINEAEGAGRFDLSSIRACLSGAAPLPVVVAERFQQLTGATVVEGYGLTEASPVTHANPLDGRARPGSIGLPLPDTDCRVVDLEDWTKDVAPGQEGELAVSGPQVMKGYLNRPEETATMIRTDDRGTRWLLTGDIARMDEDGFFRIVDRRKDMVDVSGFNVYPTEVEQVIYRHPKVQKVCVAGVPDPETGEAVKAYVVVRPGESVTAEEIVAWCRDPRFGLAAYKVPKHVEFRESLPETLIGKVLRRVLVEEERQRAGAPAPGSTSGRS